MMTKWNKRWQSFIFYTIPEYLLDALEWAFETDDAHINSVTGCQKMINH